MAFSLSTRASALAFLTAFVTLFVQILVHRIVSAKLLNNFAFLVISLTMLGFAFSGVIISRWLPRLLKHLREVVTASAALFSLSAVGVTVIFYHARVESLYVSTHAELIASLLRWIPLALLYAIPFTFAGLILGILLAAPDLPTRRIYGYDLVGSALGAVVVIPAITHLGAERSVALACMALMLGTCLFSLPQRMPARALVASAVLVVLTAAAFPRVLFTMSYPKGSILGRMQQPGSGDAFKLEYQAWDPTAHIEVSRIQPPDPRTTGYPSLIGEHRAFLSRFKRMITQNNYAFTYAVRYDGTADSLRGIDDTIYAAAYAATSVSRPHALVIGVGGGFDVLTALAYDAGDITAVEINRATVAVLTEAYRTYFREWVEDPRVHLVRDEGRHFLSATDRRFDVIQLSGVDSYSGTPGAAHVFSENYLYTAEAFSLYLSRLTEQGILNMMRLEFPAPREMLRALTTAVEALRRAGVRRPADHIMMLTQNDGKFTSLLMKKTPFSQSDQQRLLAWAADRRTFIISAGPHLNHKQDNPYQYFLSLDDAGKEAAFLAEHPFDVSPVDDDRPFFFRYSYWWHAFTSNPFIRFHMLPAMEYIILLLGATIGLATVVCIYLPLRFFAAQGLRTPHRARYALYFAGAGLAYMAIEIALMQKFGLFLGHPNYALSVVLAALLVSTGLGSLWSTPIIGKLGGIRFVSYALAGLILLAYGGILPILPNLVGLGFWARLLIVVAVIAPIGMCLGVFLPTALEQLKSTNAVPFIPWAWGINGIFSVLGPVASVAFSMTWGINALLLSAIPIYLAVGVALPDEARHA